MATIQFYKTTLFTGRNGTFKAAGLSLIKLSNGTISIQPTRTNGAVANCAISIPINSIDALIAELQKIKTV